MMKSAQLSFPVLTMLERLVGTLDYMTRAADARALPRDFRVLLRRDQRPARFGGGGRREEIGVSLDDDHTARRGGVSRS